MTAGVARRGRRVFRWRSGQGYVLEAVPGSAQQVGLARKASEFNSTKSELTTIVRAGFAFQHGIIAFFTRTQGELRLLTHVYLRNLSKNQIKSVCPLIAYCSSDPLASHLA